MCVYKRVSSGGMAELEQPTYPVQVSFGLPIEILADVVVDHLLPIENIKWTLGWHESKRLKNLKDRGVDFRDAGLVFENPVILKADTRNDYREERLRALGKVEDEYYMIAYTWRGPILWIISAWKVGNLGKRRYEKILSR
jgi:uncharacterized DUF497 family protein